jgi:phosphoglycerate dehydrogenase-like enzyme
MKVVVGRTVMQVEQSIAELRRKFPNVEFVHSSNPAELLKLVADADIFVGGMNNQLFAAAKRLKWVQQTSTGADHYLAVEGLADSDVLLTSARGTHANCVAESAMAMILAINRGICDAVLWQQSRQWGGREIRPKLVELTGSTMGIVGFGSIARAVAKMAHGHDMRIIAVDLYPGQKPDYVEAVWDMDHLNDLMRQSDYVVVTLPGTRETMGLVGANQIAAMKPSAMLVGVSRGGVIDQVAMAQALNEKRLAAAALDVMVPEPLPPDSKLWGTANLLIAPHIAGGTQFEHQHMMRILEENLSRFLRGERPLLNEIDKKQGF